jgi:GNAT superfamily N-acetyltransferase
MTIVLREARIEDADDVVPLMYESSRGLIDYSFRFPGDEPTGLLRRDFVGGRGIFGYQNQLVAVDGDKVVATMTMYRGHRATALTLQTMRSAFRHWRLDRFFAFVGRSLAIAPLFIKPRRDGIFLANACVAQSHRGRGLFTKLHSHGTEVHGATASVVELDVSFGNENARRVYEHLGFRVTGERAYRGRHALDGFRRMERAIAEAQSPSAPSASAPPRASSSCTRAEFRPHRSCP